MAETNKAEYVRALDRLTRYLALRDHSRFELQQKLKRNFSDEIIARVLNEADQNGWLLDEKIVAERLIAALARKNKSRRYIDAQLMKRRLPTVATSSEDELEKIRQLVEKKFGQASGLSYEDKGKAYRFLKYRGFDDRSIRTVLNEKP